MDIFVSKDRRLATSTIGKSKNFVDYIWKSHELRLQANSFWYKVNRASSGRCSQSQQRLTRPSTSSTPFLLSPALPVQLKTTLCMSSRGLMDKASDF
ncbi:hypothetical protein L596_000388 [Steinernema carpocapsae]|uniref:Uncharacterized protein n=1 Tax=Steinernema carpocapsae TaxID=34508 RepID=A0A4U8UM74_STECR|nr:hypothetical protein L596_000388 [Steinernema carpocapsae]